MFEVRGRSFSEQERDIVESEGGEGRGRGREELERERGREIQAVKEQRRGNGR